MSQDKAVGVFIFSRGGTKNIPLNFSRYYKKYIITMATTNISTKCIPFPFNPIPVSAK